jgi:predicted HTH domain antitoxin
MASFEDRSMGSGTIHIDLPESVLLATGQSEDEFVREAKLVLALRLFEQGRISSGRAAELCGLPRVDFLFAAGRAGIPVADLDAAELDREFSRD